MAAAKLQTIKEARTAFKNGDQKDAVRIILDSISPGRFEKIPAAFQGLLLRNATELEALVTSDAMYPPVDREAVRRLTVPTLLLSGANSTAAQKATDAELERLLPEKLRHHVVIANADHGMWFQQGAACRKAVLEFLPGK